MRVKLKKVENLERSTVGRGIMARKLKIMESEKHPLDDLKNDEITEKREKCEMHTVGPRIWQEN